MPYLGPKNESISKTTVTRTLITGYVKQLFKRPDFPGEVYIALDGGAMAFKGDIVWPHIECEHPFDFIPIARIDDLVVNLPDKMEFLQKLGVDRMEDVAPESDAGFWEKFAFEFADVAANVKLTWE
ncbi:MAG: hypothetical protein ACE5DO_03675 [Desulfobacterales bacterium]